MIAGIHAAVRSMKVGGIRRAVIPPSQGYQNASQEPLPPNVSVLCFIIRFEVNNRTEIDLICGVE